MRMKYFKIQLPLLLVFIYILIQNIEAANENPTQATVNYMQINGSINSTTFTLRQNNLTRTTQINLPQNARRSLNVSSTTFTPINHNQNIKTNGSVIKQGSGETVSRNERNIATTNSPSGRGSRTGGITTRNPITSRSQQKFKSQTKNYSNQRNSNVKTNNSTSTKNTINVKTNTTNIKTLVSPTSGNSTTASITSQKNVITSTSSPVLNGVIAAAGATQAIKPISTLLNTTVSLMGNNNTANLNVSLANSTAMSNVSAIQKINSTVPISPATVNSNSSAVITIPATIPASVVNNVTKPLTVVVSNLTVSSVPLNSVNTTTTSNLSKPTSPSPKIA